MRSRRDIGVSCDVIGAGGFDAREAASFDTYLQNVSVDWDM
jgi:hypothetical protein